ncbi:MAG: NAD(P)H-dependent oxidoreductase [Oscillospiraceae bacterium]|nr:NAD(P)H-dependent oxidoreductase [Oscillospiraceae bacterium]
MKHLISFASAVLFASLSFFTCGAESAETAPVTPSASVQDVRALRDFLLAESDGSDLADKSYDLNGDGRWNAVDLCLMKRALLAGQTPEQQTDTLVAYFSRTGNTEKIANYLIDLTGADRLVIEAAEPYSDADIRYQDDSCRANREQNDKSVRPEIAALPESLDGYDVIFLGYPIWWGDLPMPCYTFFDKVKLEGKTVAPFCTHEGSGLSGTDRYIADTTKAKVTEALEMKGATAQKNRGEAKKEVMDWLKKLGYVK